MNQPTIVDDVLGLFRAAGFEVRAPSELDPTGKFAIAGSVDAAGVLMESIIEHFGKTAEVANSCAQRGKCESEKIGAAEKPTGDLTDEQAYLTDASHPRDMQQAMEWITGLRNRIDNLLDAINAQADVEALLPELQVDLLMAESFPRTRPTSAFRSFARAIERAAIAAHLERKAQAEKPKATFDALAMARRFLGWKLPKDFCPDAGISFTPYQDPLLWPIGTNLLNEDQAKAMFEHCLKGAMRPTDDDLWDQTLRDRDANAEWADKLAGAIAEHFNVDIGEHSNMNCPWAEALEVIECAAPVSQGGDASEGLEMLDDLISSIEKHGNYSKESTLNFLGQIRQCFAAPASQEGAHAARNEKGGAA